MWAVILSMDNLPTCRNTLVKGKSSVKMSLEMLKVLELNINNFYIMYNLPERFQIVFNSFL